MVVSQQASEHVALFLMLEEVYEEMSEDGMADFLRLSGSKKNLRVHI